MGTAMAGRLLMARHDITLWNRTPARAAPLVERGARLAATPAEAARAGMAVSMLADDAAVEAVTFGADGLLSAGPGLLHIGCSTIGTALTERLTQAHADAGQRYIAAPVLGRPDVAAAGGLSLLVAGPNRDLADAATLFALLGARTIRLGERPVMAAATKLALNFGIGAIVAMLGEQMRLVERHGVDPAVLAETLIETDFGKRMIDVYAPILAEGRFEPAGFSAALGRKDMALALAAAGTADMPLTRRLAERLDRLIAQGKGTQDWAALGRLTDVEPV